MTTTPDFDDRWADQAHPDLDQPDLADPAGLRPDEDARQPERTQRPGERPTVRPAQLPRRRAPLPVAAAVAVAWAAVVSYLPVFVVAVLARLSTGGGLIGTARFAAAGWLLGHGVPIPIGRDVVSLTPLLVTGLAVWRLSRAGVHTSRAVSGHRSRSVRGALVAAGAVGLGYGLIGVVVAAWVGAPVGRAVLTLALFAAAAAGWGALRHSRAGRRLRRRIPALARDAIRTGICAALLILGVGAAAAGAALAVHGGDASAMLASYRAGVVGQSGITLVCLVFSPNIAVWGAAYLLGPGFAMGVGTVVSPGLVAVGPIPSVPVLAALPATAVSGVGSILLGIPLIAAMAAGVLLARRRAPIGWSRLLGAAALAGPVCGLALQLAGLVAGGALGSGRLAEIGPTGGGPFLWGTLVGAAGAMVGAVAVRALHRPAVDGPPPARPVPPAKVDG